MQGAFPSVFQGEGEEKEKKYDEQFEKPLFLRKQNEIL